ncbi:MAG: ABC transporter ATP-binding protein, partial [Candidatus Magnetomorum sp.]|nr:ABC transporter ATP-binding protein [Candidatus Magnetomorum sp.]
MNNNNIILSVNHLSKCYKLYDNPWHRAFEWVSNRKRIYHKPFWALQDISFQVNPGEIIGIIGQNGSGKSTLLKILSGIIQPTTGTYEIEGKLLAMLELGMDFNPNLSGKENIYRTAELWGFPKNYTKEQIGKIIEFSELGDFFERPVKLYSSGMAVRLAFSLFAFLKCDVLILDEVLAVGDIFFHQKCYKRIEKLVSDQTTIILVTHNMADVQAICNQAIVLDKGHIFFKGNAKEAAYMYYQIRHKGTKNVIPLQKVKNRDLQSGNECTDSAEKSVSDKKPYWPPDEVFTSIPFSNETTVPARLTKIAICNEQGMPCTSFNQGDFAHFFYEFYLYQDIDVPITVLSLTNKYNVTVHGKASSQYNNILVPAKVQKNTYIRTCQCIHLKLSSGEYVLSCSLCTMPKNDYDQRYHLMQADLMKRISILTAVDGVGYFIITNNAGEGLQGRYFGICDLPGSCQVMISLQNSEKIYKECSKNKFPILISETRSL